MNLLYAYVFRPPAAAAGRSRYPRAPPAEGGRRGEREKGVREEEGLTCGPHMSVGPHFFVCE